MSPLKQSSGDSGKIIPVQWWLMPMHFSSSARIHHDQQADQEYSPHEREECALLGHTADTKHRFERLNALRALGHWVVSKASTTVILPPCPSSPGWVCTWGSPNLGVAGSGDVLAGMLAGLCARMDSLGDAIKLGVSAHACAGERDWSLVPVLGASFQKLSKSWMNG